MASQQELFFGDSSIEKASYSTYFANSLEELESLVEDMGLGQDDPKLVSSALVFEKGENDSPSWEVNEPFETTASVTSLLETAALISSRSDQAPNYAQIIFDVQKGAYEVTACFHWDPKIIEAGGLPYKVVIKNNNPTYVAS